MKRAFWAVFISFLVLLVVFFGAAYYLLRSKDFQKKIISQAEKQFQSRISLESVHLSWVPPISLILKNVQFVSEREGLESLVSAPTVRISLNLWPLLFKKIELKHVRLQEALCSLNWKGADPEKPRRLVFRNADIQFWNVAIGKKMKFAVRANFGESSGTVGLDGEMTLALAKNGLSPETLESKIQFKKLEMKKIAESLAILMPVSFERGEWSWSGEVSLRGGLVKIKGTGELREAVYELVKMPGKMSLPADFGIETVAEWKLAKREFHLSALTLRSKYGDFTLKGVWGSQEQGRSPIDFEIKSPNLDLDKLPEILLPFDKVIPTRFGFSGRLEANCFFRGDPDALGIAGTLDLTPSLLSFGGLLTKPKDCPLKAQLNLVLKEGKELEGDFSFWLNELSLKGNVGRFDVSSGDGELTFLTNKFSLNGWEKILQPFQGYPLAGSGKVLLSMKGKLLEADKVSYTGTISVEEGSVQYELFPVRDLNATFEFSNIRASSGELSFVGGNSPFRAEFVWNMLPHPSLTVIGTAPEFYLFEVEKPIEDFASKTKNIAAGKILKNLSVLIQKTVSEEASLKEVSFKAGWAGSTVSLEALSFSLYDGKVKARGDFEFNPNEPSYNFSLAVEKMNLQPLLDQMTGGKTVMSGELNLLGDFEGDSFFGETAAERFQGKGEFNVIGGAFRTFDLLSAIAQLSDFQGIQDFSRGATEFNDFHSGFVIRNRKVVTDNLLLANPYFKAVANGFFDLEGGLNYRCTVSLSDAMFRKIFPELPDLRDVDAQLYGNLLDPKIGFDTGRISETLGKTVSDRLAAKNMASKPPEKTVPSETDLWQNQ